MSNPNPNPNPTPKPDDIPDVGSCVQWRWETDQGDQWYGGKVIEVNDDDVIVLYDDGTTVPHPHGTCRHRHTWYYDEMKHRTPVKKRKLDRGSGSKGERNGGDFDQYERNEQDGNFYGEAQRIHDCAQEARYAKRRRREQHREKADPKRQGYEDDGFVVPDDD